MEPYNLADYELTKNCLNWFVTKNENANALKSGALHIGGAVATLLSSAAEAVAQVATVIAKIIPATLLSTANSFSRCLGNEDFDSIKKYGIKAVGKHAYQAIKYTLGTLAIPVLTLISPKIAQDFVGTPRPDAMKKATPPPPPPPPAGGFKPIPKSKIQDNPKAEATAPEVEAVEPSTTVVEPINLEAPKVETMKPEEPKAQPMKPAATKVETPEAEIADARPAATPKPPEAAMTRGTPPPPPGGMVRGTPPPPPGGPSGMAKGTPPPPPPGVMVKRPGDFKVKTPPAEKKPEATAAQSDAMKKQPSRAPNSFAEQVAAQRKVTNAAADAKTQAEADEREKRAYERKEAADKEKAALAQAEKAKTPEPGKRPLSRASSGASTPRAAPMVNMLDQLRTVKLKKVNPTNTEPTTPRLPEPTKTRL